MFEWLLGVFLGFVGEFLRSLVQDHAANSALREAGRLDAENSALKELIKAIKAAQEITGETDAETDFNSILDRL